MIPYIITPGKSVTFYVNGTPYQAQASAVNIEAVLNELKSPNPDTDLLIMLVTPAQAIEAAVNRAADRLPKGVVSVTRSEVRYNGDPIKGVLVERILWLLSEGFDIMPMVRFLENLFQNPADFAREELYLWLENSNLPITEDGHFLAYKNVNGDFTSIHDNKTDNTPGNVVSMPRDDVDTDRDNTCSRGLHFCSKDYLPNFSHGRDNTTILLKINPADVVSIPSDYDNAKGRAWQYEVLSAVDFDPQDKVWPALVGNDGEEFVGTIFDTDNDALDVTSDLGKTLFAMINEYNPMDRQERLDWASDILDRDITSFNSLLVGEAHQLIDSLDDDLLFIEDGNDDIDFDEDEDEDEGIDLEGEIQKIYDLGIIQLRRRAAGEGYKGAWKGPRADDLRQYLIARI